MLGRMKNTEKTLCKYFFKKNFFRAKNKAKIRAKERLIKRLSKESKREFFINLRKYLEEKNSKTSLKLEALVA